MRGALDFNEVYHEYRPKILHYLSRLAGPHEAEDIAQEVFEKVSRALESFRGESRLSTWLYRIATNAALNRLNSPSFDNSPGRAISESSSEAEDRNVWTGERRSSPDQGLIRKEMNECIRGFIDRLSPDYRTVVVLSELEGFKNKEIADILRVSIDTVKIRLHRARARLRKELEANCSFYHSEKNVLSCDLKTAINPFKESD